MPTCTATTKLGAPCRNNCKAGSTHCGIHSRLRNVAVFDHVCECMKRDGSPCGKGALGRFEEQWVCKYHHTILLRTFYRHNARRILEVTWNGYQHGVELDTIFNFVEEAYQRHEIDEGWFNIVLDEIDRFPLLDFAMHNGPPPRDRAIAAAHVATIGDIAVDPQSVHTSVVSEQTNRAMDVLLAQSIPASHDTLKKLPPGFRANRSLYSDMRRWYKQSTCRAVDDWLYRKTLDGVWMLIQSRPTEERDELVQRLFEEAKESIGMCCEGHISRLCNVLVGFDDRFAPSASVGEQLQMRMAAIANEEIATELKVERAVGVFRELAVPEDQWDGWIEAF
jgi:hypothetical protein